MYVDPELGQRGWEPWLDRRGGVDQQTAVTTDMEAVVQYYNGGVSLSIVITIYSYCCCRCCERIFSRRWLARAGLNRSPAAAKRPTSWHCFAHMAACRNGMILWCRCFPTENKTRVREFYPENWERDISVDPRGLRETNDRSTYVSAGAEKKHKSASYRNRKRKKERQKEKGKKGKRKSETTLALCSAAEFAAHIYIGTFLPSSEDHTDTGWAGAGGLDWTRL